MNPEVHTAETVPVEPVKSIHDHWNELVAHVIRKAKGLKPEDTIDLPAGETGHYVAYALDKHGRLSTGKGHGRLKVRLKPHQAEGNRLAGKLFVNYLSSIFAANQMLSPAPAALTQEQMQKAQAYSLAKAEEIMHGPSKTKAKAARRRQRLSRRGGGPFRAVHTEERAFNLSFYSRTRQPQPAAI